MSGERERGGERSFGGERERGGERTFGDKAETAGSVLLAAEENAFNVLAVAREPRWRRASRQIKWC